MVTLAGYPLALHNWHGPASVDPLDGEHISMQATDAPVSMVATRITREGSDEVAAKKALSRRRPQPQFSERMRGRKQVENVKSRHMRKGKLAQLREQSKREELRERGEREEHALWKREEGQGASVLEERQSGGGGKEPIAGTSR